MTPEYYEQLKECVSELQWRYNRAERLTRSFLVNPLGSSQTTISNLEDILPDASFKRIKDVIREEVSKEVKRMYDEIRDMEVPKASAKDCNETSSLVR